MSFGENARRREDNLDQSALMLLALDRKGCMIGLDQALVNGRPNPVPLERLGVASAGRARRRCRYRPQTCLPGIANANNGASRVSEGRGDNDMAARLIELHRI